MYYWKATIKNKATSEIKTIRMSTKENKAPREIHVKIKAESKLDIPAANIEVTDIIPALHEALEYKAAIIKTDGTISEAIPTNGNQFTLKEMQGIVGGYIETVFHAEKDRPEPHDSLPARYMVCNEEGKLNNLPINKQMSEIWKDYLGYYGNIVVGNVLICDPDMLA